jgi:Tol biopolymer transport system component
MIKSPAVLLLCLLPAVAQAPPESKYLRNIRQLTHGGQNAEAYWAPDGKRLVFQSTREPYQCDQIFIMNDDGSDQRLVSTGKGRTTCAYFLKDNRHIVYGSTHERDEKCPPPPDRSKGYVWAVFPGYDIYLATDRGEIRKKLTTAEGYDAEATVNWKTNKIVYTSMSTGDLELWEMKTDGSGKKQITKSEGYDGGAFYSRDGKRLVWRATDRNNLTAMERYRQLIKENLTEPMKMEIWTANADGSRAKQITNFGCASFAPTFTPHGSKIVFSSNRHNCDGRRFELFMMNPDGSAVEQITSFGGFVSFPEFSPDGKRLVFSSDLNARSRYEFNIFLAEWAP